MKHHSQDFGLERLVHLVRKGELALPEFQRDFVWEPNAVVELIESITNGWPIGALLILEGPQPFGIRAIEGAPAPSRDDVTYFLLDGQQRVTSIFHALTGTGDVRYFFDFTADSDNEVGLKWVKNAKREPKQGTISLVDYLDADRTDAITADWPSGARRRATRMRDALVGVLKDDSYAIPATVMSEDIELEALTRIFETLNRTGVRLNAFDLVVASQYSPRFSLRDRWNELRDVHKILDDFDTDGIEPLKLLALRFMHSKVGTEFETSSRRPVEGVRQRDVLNLPPEAIRTHWEPTVLKYVETLDFLRAEAGVTDSGSVPSGALILTIAYWRSENHVSDADILRWYWQAIATQRYSQGANTRVVADTDPKLDAPPKIPSEAVRDRLQEAIADSPRRNKMLRMGLRGLAITLSMLDPITGEPIHGPVRELDINQLRSSSEEGPKPDPTIEGSMWMTEQSARKIRAAARRSKDLRATLNSAAVQSQGLMFGNDGSLVAPDRGLFLIKSVMEEA